MMAVYHHRGQRPPPMSPSSGSEEFPLRLVSEIAEPSLAADGSINFARSTEAGQAVPTQSISTVDLALPVSTVHHTDSPTEPSHRCQWWSIDALRKNVTGAAHRWRKGDPHSLVALSVDPLALQSSGSKASNQDPATAVRHVKDPSDGVSSTEAAEEAALRAVTQQPSAGKVAFPGSVEISQGVGRPTKVSRRVSFSPSVDGNSPKMIREVLVGEEDKRSMAHVKSSLLTSRPSLDDFQRRSRRPNSQCATGRSIHLEAYKVCHRRSRSELTVDRDGIHVSLPSADAHRNRHLQPSDAGHAKVKVSKQTALAQRHARALEQLINASSPSATVVVGKSRQQKKVISHKQVTQLKKALLDAKLANGIIGELRMMDISDTQFRGTLCEPSLQLHSRADQESSPAKDALRAVRERQMGATTESNHVELHVSKSSLLHRAGKQIRQSLASNATSRSAEGFPRSTLPVGANFCRPLRAVCLDCNEVEADQRHLKATQSVRATRDVAMGEGGKAASDSDSMDLLGYLSGLGQGSPSATPADAPTSLPSKGQLSSATAALAASTVTPSLSGVAALNLFASPTGKIVATGLDASGAFVALGNLSGAAIRASGTNEGIYPPMDRMTLFVHWWGYEVTLPKTSMSYLGTARSVSGAFLNFLSTMVITGGVSELLPFVKYMSMAVDVEFKAIQSADRGHGVVLAATWVMPLALVPRAWDYPTIPPPARTLSAPTNDTTSQQSGRTLGIPATKASLQSTTAASPELSCATLGFSRGSSSRSPSPSLGVRPNDAAINAVRRESFVGDLSLPASGSTDSTDSSVASLSGTPRASVALERLEGIPEGGESSHVE